MRMSIFFTSIVLFIFVMSTPLNAAKVAKVKGKKAYIMTQGDSMSAGEFYYVLKGGKKKGIVKIVKVKGEKALAKVVKGRIKKGWPLMLRAKGGSSSKTASGSSSSGKSSFYIGVLGGYGSPSMDVKQIGNAQFETSMTGSTISAIAFADYSLTSRIGVRGTIGYEMINLANEADTQCGRTNAEKCFADMSFFTAGLLGQFSLINMSMFELWLGGGSSLFQPMSSESSAISNVSTMFVLTLAGGIEIHVSKGFKIPLQFDYNFIPPTDTVLNTSFITGKFGLAFAF